MSQDTGTGRPVSPVLDGATANKDRTLLIVDDDAAFRNRTARAFEQRGFIVSAVGSVAEALAQNLRREERTADYSRTIERLGAGRGGAQSATANAGGQLHEPLGSSYRTSESRSFRRTSAANANRDKKA